MQYKIRTIGIQQLSFDDFKKIVEDILVIDVRRRANPMHYSEKYLTKNLPNYCHIADVGPTKEIRERYKEDKNWEFYKRDYLLYLETPEGKKALKKCIDKIKLHKEVFLMCYERFNDGILCSEDDIQCHRRLLKDWIIERLRI